MKADKSNRLGLPFRLLLCTPSEVLERPIQTFHPDLESARSLAPKLLAGHNDDAFVVIFEFKEVVAEQIFKEPVADPQRAETENAIGK